MHPYQQLLSPYPLLIAETESSYSFVTERHIQALWFEQKYFENLKSLEGEFIDVISPGIWNLGMGPDFLKAHLRINGIDRRGDIEIHLSPDSWYSHEHHKNKNYNNVILHLYLWKGKLNKKIYTQSEVPIVQVCLGDHLTIQEEKIVQLIDLELYPYKEFVGSGRCAHSLFSTLSEDKIKKLLQLAADWRLIKKKETLSTIDQQDGQSLMLGIATALGYKKNSETFQSLYRWLRERATLEEEALLALSLGMCGFFDLAVSSKWEKSSYYCHLKAYYFMLSMNEEPLPRFNLQLNQIRPYNHPIRRMVYLIKLLIDPKTPSLMTRIWNWWNETWKTIFFSSTRSKPLKELHTFFPTYQDEYWNQHLLFETEQHGDSFPLIGESLKNEIIYNTILPLLRERIYSNNRDGEREAFQLLYQSLPGSKTSKTKYLTHRFFGNRAQGVMLDKAIHEQGAYQLHRDFCLHYESSCVGCPFVDRYNERMSTKYDPDALLV